MLCTTPFKNPHQSAFSLGISEMIFNGQKSGSVGLKHSITVDMTLPMELLKRIEANKKMGKKMQTEPLTVDNIP